MLATPLLDSAAPLAPSSEGWPRFAQALLGIHSAAIEAPTLPDLLRDVHAHLHPVLRAELWLLAVVDDVAGQLRYLRPGLPVTTDLCHDNTLMAQAVRLRLPLASEALRLPAETAALAPGLPRPASFIVLPLLTQGRVGAVLAVGSDTPHAYDDDALGFMNLVAATLTLAVEKSRLYEAMPHHTQALEERVRAHTAALESEKTRFESIVQSLGEGLILLDLYETVTFANARAQSLLGLPLERLVGLTIAELWRGPDLRVHSPERVSRDFGLAVQTIETYPSFNVSRSAPAAASGEAARAQDLRLKLFPVRDHAGQLFHYGLILQDITREREMDRMKDELVNVVSHELRTPLASVLGFAELLLSREFPDARRRMLIETIHKEAERLTGLINDFLDLRRLENGRQEITFADVRLTEVIHGAVASFALNQRAHTFTVQLPESMPLVRADGNRLGDVIRNLIGNAIKYSPRGGPITLQAALVEAELQVTVKDEGLGLPAEVIPQLFQRFYRVDSSDRREIGGTGLGLAIVKEIIAAHGGRVWAESAGPGCGSTFTFALPISLPAADDQPPQTVPDGPYVLVVEDDAGQVTLIEEHLRSAALAVVAVPHPQSALQLLSQRQPVGVIMDVCLPEAEAGWVLLEAIRQRHAPSQLPVIVTTVLEERTRGLAAGATEFLVKPYDPRQLIAYLQPHRGREVLVVEDEPIITKLVNTVLTKAGYHVRAVADGPSALAHLSDHQPDALLLDLMLPAMDGFTVLEHVRALPGGPALPVLVMTAKSLSHAEHERLRHLGAEVLPKSAHTALRLRAALERAIQGAPPPHPEKDAA